MVERHFKPSDPSNILVADYCIIEYKEPTDYCEKKLTLSSLRGNCWIFILSDLPESQFKKNSCYFYEINKFSEKMERFAFEFSTKFKILYIQFEFGIFLSKIICQEFNMIKNKIKSLLNFDNNWDILPSILNAYFSNLNFENTYKFNLTVQIIQLLNQNPTLKIKELSKSFYLCNRQLQRIVQENTGHSLKFCQKYLRLRNCIQLIVTLNKNNFNDIIYTMGYTDYNHFIKDFKGFYGVTPTKFFKSKVFINENIYLA